MFGLQPRLNLKEISQADSAFHNSTAWGSKHCYGYCRKKIGMYGKNINGKGCNRWNYALRLFKRILLHLVHVEWNVRYIFGTLVSLKFSYFMERKIKNFLGRFSVNAWFHISIEHISSYIIVSIEQIWNIVVSRPKFVFSPTFVFCSPICPNNCGVVFLWKYTLVFEKFFFRSTAQICKFSPWILPELCDLM